MLKVLRVMTNMNVDTTNLGILIPKSIENLHLPDDSLLNFYEGLEDRTFWINDEINIYSLNLIHYILKWNKEDKDISVENRKPIKLFFFSPGGDIDINYAIIDTIKLSKTPVYGINVGQCASAAAFIYLSCHMRLMLPHAYFLFHQGSGRLSGTFAEIYAQMEEYQLQVEELAIFMANHTKYTEEEIAEKIVNEWYIRREEAIDKGICGKVISNIDDL